MTQRPDVRAGARSGDLDVVGGGGSTGSAGRWWRATVWVAAGALALSAAVVAPPPAAMALAPQVEQKLTASDAAAGDDFGWSVAVAGDG